MLPNSKLCHCLIFLWAMLSSSLLSAQSISPNDENIRYAGVIDTIENGSKLELYRLKKDYIDAPFSTSGGDWTAKNAGTQPGIRISIKTASPSVTFNFSLNTTYEDRWARMALYRNDVLVETKQL